MKGLRAAAPHLPPGPPQRRPPEKRRHRRHAWKPAAEGEGEEEAPPTLKGTAGLRSLAPPRPARKPRQARLASPADRFIAPPPPREPTCKKQRPPPWRLHPPPASRCTSYNVAQRPPKASALSWDPQGPAVSDEPPPHFMADALNNTLSPAPMQGLPVPSPPPQVHPLCLLVTPCPIPVPLPPRLRPLFLMARV